MCDCEKYKAAINDIARYKDEIGPDVTNWDFKKYVMSVLKKHGLKDL